MKKNKKSKKVTRSSFARIKANLLINKVRYALIAWFTFSWSWVMFTDTLDLAGNRLQGILIAGFVLAINVALSCFIMLKVFNGLGLLFKRFSPLVATLLAWPLLAFADFLVAWVPAAFWIGPEGRLDSILPLSTPAMVAINTPLAYASRLVGFFGIAGLVWLVVYLLWTKRYVLAATSFGVMSIVSLVGWQAWKTPNGSTIKATVISESLTDRVVPIKTDSSDLVIFPEYGLDDITDQNYQDRIKRSNHSKTYFLGSKQVVQADRVGHLNRQVYGNNKEGITFEQDKYRLIPGGEDLPYILRILLRATNQKDTLDYFSYAKGTLKGKYQLEPLQMSNGSVIGAAVCSSIISPEDYRQFVNSGSTLLSNSASLTIFKGSPLFAWQQKSLGKFMAIANSRYFLQSANSARAYVLDNNGKTLVEKSGKEAVTLNVKNNSKRTFYGVIGEFTIIIGGLIALFYIIAKLRAWKKLAN